MANSDWILSYSSGRCEYLRFEGSDHRPVVTSFYPMKKKQHGIFRFNRRLRENPELKKLVFKACKEAPNQKVDSLLRTCREYIIKRSQSQELNSQKKILTLRDQLEEAMSDDTAPQESIDMLNKELHIAYQKEEAFWKQRSRNLWLALGDKNTGFFHATTKSRNACNNILVIEDPEGRPVFEEKDIASTISNYFQKRQTVSTELFRFQ
ncbi:PREDICTED: uncharacterized protein LOC104738340 [Camelina sativa]|uniref:Uncharacterized protein LOC104738340 n=1 Tax=Camelina sativa TaxID=90675 RepID=A0ABM0VIS1_CAMSA|nr:PREDICTED: uncharacterized protein LOC104738340 [Camelina sativa]